MFGNWAEQARKGLSEATEKAAEGLAKAGDSISKAAANPNANHKVQRPKPVNVMSPRNLESIPAEEAAAAMGSGAASSSSTPTAGDIRARAAAALARADEKQHQRRESAANNAGSVNASTTSTTTGGMGKMNMPNMSLPQINMKMDMKNMKMPELKSPVFTNMGQNMAKGWTNVVDSAKKGVAAAQEAVEKEQIRLELLMQQRDVPKYYSRDVALPLDVAALKNAEVVYVTDRIISMSHPALPSQAGSPVVIPGDRKLAAVTHLLEKRHGRGNVMIWNLSEVTDYHQHAADVLERVGPILAFSFPGSPAPPLGLWLQLLLSLEKWLQASPDHVAVVHCLTGKGRTSTVVAAFLCWMAEAGFENTNMTSALEYIAQCKKMSVDELTIPSQRRYAQYFTNMLEGIRPKQPPLVLKRIIMSEAPHFALGPPLTHKNKDKNDGTDNGNSSNSKNNDEDGVGENRDRMGCAPYLQVFQAGQLLHTVAATLHFQQQPDALPFCQVADGSIAFHVDQVIQGDVLIRCRHLAHSTRQKISMFRSAFHTGYAPPNVLRFTKVQLDGACNDPRFPDDFFVDLIFEPCTNEQAAQFYQQQEDELHQKEQAAAESNEHVEKDAVVSASTYDSMLHSDSRFWDVISDHLKEGGEEKSKATDDLAAETSSGDTDKEKSKMWGPTVGKRRVFTSPPKSAESIADGTVGGTKGPADAAQTPLQTFSIGGELDFLPEPEKPATPSSKPKQLPKKDTLMEALMGALDMDDDHDHHQEPAPTEEIVFDDDAPAFAPEPAAAAAAQPQPTIVALPPAPGPPFTEGSDALAVPTSSGDVSPLSTEAPKEAAPKEPDTATPAITATTSTTVPPPDHQDSTVTTESMKDMEKVLGTTTAVDDDDLDMDALLADDDDDDFNLDDYDVDAEDAELEDLEAFLNAK